ncbi:MAG: CCA tRNA nucleotidyltransferase [Candidatus Omnitrophica bacterium]|nr:CCA tRNA nucleotidyltransferase [Candidatus Omnitrophota bacterium]
MKEYLKKLPQEIQGLIKLAGEVASSRNMPAYLVGGFVRDLILGVPNLDLDIVVEGDGISFAQDFGCALRKKIIRHLRFGTATIMYSDELKIDIATARKEYYPKPAHLPVIEGSSLKDDHFRRDFTINAMAIAINTASFGKLIDTFGGVEDLRNKKIRILHDLSFIDDPTRILRAVRFEQRYNFKIEPKTLKLLKQAVNAKMLEKVEPQRTRDELVLALKEERPLKEIKRLKEIAGFGFLSPLLILKKNNYDLLVQIEKEVNWFKKNYSERRNLDTWLIYLIGLTDALNKKSVEDICRRFSFRRGETKRLLNYKEISPKSIIKLAKLKVKPSWIFSFFEPLSYEVIIALKAKYKNKYIQKHIKDFFEIYNGMSILCCGEDLRKIGILPGPHYQNIFSKVLNAKLNGEVKTKEDELLLIRKLFN